MRLLVILQLIRPGKLLCAHITFIREPIVNDQRVFSQLVLSHGLVATLGAGVANLLVDALHVLLEPVLAWRGEGAEVARVADAQVDGVAVVHQAVLPPRRELAQVTVEPGLLRPAIQRAVQLVYDVQASILEMAYWESHILSHSEPVY